MKAEDATRTATIALAFLLLVVFAVGCATRFDLPTTTTNPPPAVKFSEFRSFEMKPIVIAPEFAEAGANQKATRKIQENLDAGVAGTLNAWNRANRNTTRGTLVIEPLITQIKFISGGARFMVGAMAGSSAIVMEVSFKERESGELIAKPQFYQRGSAVAGAYSVGATDNMMITRIAELVSDYIRANYEAAVGGPTGTSE